jgi:SEC-C motif domain protein
MNAQSLMRSRYSAYLLQNKPYLLASWHPATRPQTLNLNQAQRWLGLKILRVEAGQATDECGVVEFVARYKIAGKGFRLHEVSRFSRHQGHWFYVDGDLVTQA